MLGDGHMGRNCVFFCRGRKYCFLKISVIKLMNWNVQNYELMTTEFILSTAARLLESWNNNVTYPSLSSHHHKYNGDTIQTACKHTHIWERGYINVYGRYPMWFVKKGCIIGQHLSMMMMMSMCQTIGSILQQVYALFFYKHSPYHTCSAPIKWIRGR